MAWHQFPRVLWLVGVVRLPARQLQLARAHHAAHYDYFFLDADFHPGSATRGLVICHCTIDATKKAVVLCPAGHIIPVVSGRGRYGNYHPRDHTGLFQHHPTGGTAFGSSRYDDRFRVSPLAIWYRNA